MLVGWKYVGWSKEVWFASKLAAWLHHGKHPYPAQERDGCVTQSQASATSRRDILLEKFRDSTTVTDKLFRVNKKIVSMSGACACISQSFMLYVLYLQTALNNWSMFHVICVMAVERSWNNCSLDTCRLQLFNLKLLW
jgi:hypothetical protein